MTDVSNVVPCSLPRYWTDCLRGMTVPLSPRIATWRYPYWRYISTASDTGYGSRVSLLTKSTMLLFVQTAWHIKRPLPVQLFGEPVQLGHAAGHLGQTVHKQLTLSRHTGWKQGSPGIWRASPSPYQENLYVSCTVFWVFALGWPLLSPAGDPLLASNAWTCVMSIQFTSLCIATGHFTTLNICENLEVKIFASYTRTLTEGFDSTLAGARNLLFW
jgi:hypothetical protein